MLNNPTILSDVLTASWIAGIVTLLFFALPSWLLGDRANRCPIDRMSNGFVRMSAVMFLGALLWARLGLLTWFTAVITTVFSLFMVWLFGSSRHPNSKIEAIGHKVLAVLIDTLDRGISFRKLWRSIRRRIAGLPGAMAIPDAATAIGLVVLGIVLLIAGYLRFAPSLAELRFTSPDSYAQLLMTQQILSRDTSLFNGLISVDGQVPILAVLTSLISLLASVDAIYAQHFTMAIIGCWLVAALGYLLWKLTDSLPTGVIGMLGVGVYLFTWSGSVDSNRSERTQIWLGNIINSLNQGWVRQWNPSELELGVVFLLLGLATVAQVSKRAQRFDGCLSGICCLLILLMTAPPLVLLLLVGGISIILGRQVALFMVAITWFWLAILSAIPDQSFFVNPVFLKTLSIDLSLLLAMGFLLGTAAFRSLLGVWTEIIGLILVLGIALNFFWPNNLAIEHVEYEASARKTLEISKLLPYKNWTLVAPNEQLSQSFRKGWYEDLAKFVDKYQDLTSSPAFRWPLKTADVLVMVEKKPFQLARDYNDVSYSTLVDPVYANYRSSVGRSQLQAKARKMCENYVQSHPGSKIYYEDEVIKIYQFPGNESLK